MNLSEFDYELPEELIAQYPADKRDDSRLLVVDKNRETVNHAIFSRLPEFLKPGDLLILNNTQVIPARLIGEKSGTGGTVELLLLEEISNKVWRCMFKRGKRLPVGTEVIFQKGRLQGAIGEKIVEGRGVVEFSCSGDFLEMLKEYGRIPLPPYIKRKPGDSFNDTARYQTVFARKPGSSAAPTAGLHFTENLLNEIKKAGVHVAHVTLHVGPGTFNPIRSEEIERHKMEPEYFSVLPETKEAIEKAQRDKSRIISVGSTSLRCVESACDDAAVWMESGHTHLFILPGYRFKRVNGLITNFHLPKTTLFVLVCAFAGKSLMQRAYRESIKRRYRFYSYGDAMLIL